MAAPTDPTTQIDRPKGGAGRGRASALVAVLALAALALAAVSAWTSLERGRHDGAFIAAAAPLIGDLAEFRANLSAEALRLTADPERASSAAHAAELRRLRARRHVAAERAAMLDALAATPRSFGLGRSALSQAAALWWAGAPGAERAAAAAAVARIMVASVGVGRSIAPDAASAAAIAAAAAALEDRTPGALGADLDQALEAGRAAIDRMARETSGALGAAATVFAAALVLFLATIAFAAARLISERRPLTPPAEGSAEPIAPVLRETASAPAESAAPQAGVAEDATGPAQPEPLGTSDDAAAADAAAPGGPHAPADDVSGPMGLAAAVDEARQDALLEAALGKPAPVSAPGPGAPRVLVVDDAAGNRRVLALALSRAGFVVDEARGGLEALEKAADVAYALITLDLTMPDLAGLDVAERLRGGDGPSAAATLFIVTAEPQRVDAARAERLGVVAVLGKPVNLSALTMLARQSAPATSAAASAASDAAPALATATETAAA